MSVQGLSTAWVFRRAKRFCSCESIYYDLNIVVFEKNVDEKNLYNDEQYLLEENNDCYFCIVCVRTISAASVVVYSDLTARPPPVRTLALSLHF